MGLSQFDKIKIRSQHGALQGWAKSLHSTYHMGSVVLEINLMKPTHKHLFLMLIYQKQFVKPTANVYSVLLSSANYLRFRLA